MGSVLYENGMERLWIFFQMCDKNGAVLFCVWLRSANGGEKFVSHVLPRSILDLILWLLFIVIFAHSILTLTEKKNKIKVICKVHVLHLA
jgi:hypothetical protein